MCYSIIVVGDPDLHQEKTILGNLNEVDSRRSVWCTILVMSVLESGDLASVPAVKGHGFSLVPSACIYSEFLLFLSRRIQAFYHLLLIECSAHRESILDVRRRGSHDGIFISGAEVDDEW